MEGINVQKYVWTDSSAFVESIQLKPITDADKNIIQTLKTSYSFPKEVINILLELALSINDNSLHPAVVYEIADNWEALHIMDLPTALEESEDIKNYLLKRNRKKHYRCITCSSEFMIILHSAKFCPVCASKDVDRLNH